MQIAAVPSRAEPDEGEINYPGVFAALDRLGWSGWTACEYKPAGAHRGWPRLGRAFGLKAGRMTRSGKNQGNNNLYGLRRPARLLDCRHVGQKAQGCRSDGARGGRPGA